MCVYRLLHKVLLFTLFNLLFFFTTQQVFLFMGFRLDDVYFSSSRSLATDKRFDYGKDDRSFSFFLREKNFFLVTLLAGQ